MAWTQVVNFRHWLYVGIRAWMDSVAGGDAPSFGRLVPAEKVTPGKAVRKAVTRLPNGKVLKALGGPQEHEVFEAYPATHAITKLFRNPNGPDVAYDLWAWTILFLKLTGVARWWVLRNTDTGVPVEIWIMPTHWCRMVTDNGRPLGFIMQNPWGTSQDVPWDDVVSFYEHSPLNRYEGYAVNIAIAEWLETYDSNTRARMAQYKNGAIPAFHVQLGDSYSDPDEASLTRFYSKFASRFQGENNTGRPLITGPDTDVKALGISPVDMRYHETEEQLMTMILASLGVPKASIGLTDTMTYGSVRAAEAQFYNRINPTLKYMGEVISEKVVKRTPGCEDGVGFWDERATHDPELFNQEVEQDFKNGMLTPEEYRSLRGREPYPLGGKNPVVQGVEMPWVVPIEGDHELDHETAQKMLGDHVSRAMGEASGSAGGFLVHPENGKPLITMREEDFDPTGNGKQLTGPLAVRKELEDKGYHVVVLPRSLPLRKNRTDDRFTVAVDLHRTLMDSDLNGYEDSEPIDGAKEAMQAFRDAGYRIVVWTVWSDLDGVHDWLAKHGVVYDFVNAQPFGANLEADYSGKGIKIDADLYIDDKGLHFTNWDDAKAETFRRAQAIGKRLINRKRLHLNGVH